MRFPFDHFVLVGEQGGHSALTINGEDVEGVSSFKFLETHIWEDLTWSFNTTALVQRAQQWLTQENQRVCCSRPFTVAPSRVCYRTV